MPTPVPDKLRPAIVWMYREDRRPVAGQLFSPEIKYYLLHYYSYNRWRTTHCYCATLYCISI